MSPVKAVDVSRDGIEARCKKVTLTQSKTNVQNKLERAFAASLAMDGRLHAVVGQVIVIKS